MGVLFDKWGRALVFRDIDARLGAPGERLPSAKRAPKNDQWWLPSVFWLLDCLEAGKADTDGVVHAPDDLLALMRGWHSQNLTLRVTEQGDEGLLTVEGVHMGHRDVRLTLGVREPGTLLAGDLARFPQQMPVHEEPDSA